MLKKLVTFASSLADRALAPFAPVAGWTARVLVRYGFGLAGALCIVVGFSMIAEPAGWLAAGALLLAIDRKVP